MICHYKSKIYWRDAFKKKLSFLKTGFFRVKKSHFLKENHQKIIFFQKICMQSIILVFNKLTPTKMSMKTNFYPNLMSMEYFRAKNAFLSPAAWRKGDIVVTRVIRPSVRPAGWASTFIAVSAITHKLFAISI